MSELKIRRIPWEFDESVPFQWNPDNPHFGMIGNVVTFIAPALERYMVSTTRLAKKRMRDPAAREEADLFATQEALHARAHRNHAAALWAQYPGLEEVYRDANRAFDELLETKPLAYHLAYMADLEATFMPLFSLVLDNHETLLANGDDRVASMLLWHFTEEIEHRSSALVLYRAVVGSDRYRLTQVPSMYRHITGVAMKVLEGFNEHVPFEDRLVDAMSGDRREQRRHRQVNKTTGFAPPFGRVPRKDLVRMFAGLIRTEVPGYDPTRDRLPPLAIEWMRTYDRGNLDSGRWYRAQPAPA